MTIVNKHFALRISKFDSQQKPSGRGDGMFIRPDGGLTEAKVSAKVFNTALDAAKFFEDECVTKDWMKNTPGCPVFVVEVVTKTVVKQASSTGVVRVQ